MTQLKWRHIYSVNVDEIDRQHQAIIQMSNDLREALQARQGKEMVGTIIKQLFSYAQTHFIYEEKYFKKFGYPDAEKHIIEHHKFVDKVFDFIKGYDKGRLGLAGDILDFLDYWLVEHVQNFDKKYEPFFNEHGLK